MITVSEATKTILDHSVPLGTSQVALHDAVGHVLAEDLVADRDFPPFERVTMDGIAIAFKSWEDGQRAFPIQETLGAGSPQGMLQDVEHCIEIMTGAVLPAGADTVIRYEDVEIAEGVARINVPLRHGQNVHHKGEDRVAGSMIVKRGSVIDAAVVGVAATVGRPNVTVLEKPRICIISTGDELIPVDMQPLPHQIRRSNVYAIAALLENRGVGTTILHIGDDRQEIQESLAGLLEENHALVLSGGVSKGKYDFVPDALDSVGVVKHFHRVLQRPGKPFWFGTWKDRCAVFALPGNPVSSFMSTLRYVIPWLSQSRGVPVVAEFAELAAPFRFAKDLTYFLQVALAFSEDGRVIATPVPGHGSGDHANLVEAQGFLELPGNRDTFAAGEAYRLWRY